MERLTIRVPDGIDYKPKVYWWDIKSRLAAYEDTGLTPEEITALKSNDTGRAQTERAALNMAVKLQKERDTLKKALELACFSRDYTPSGHTLMDYYIQQAQEQEEKNNG